MKQLTCLLVLSIMASACSSDDEEEPETAATFCERWAEAACADEVVSACQAAGVDQCRASQAARCLGALPAGEFSGASADQCIEAVEAAYEDADITPDEIRAVLRFEAPCDQLVKGSAAEGEACATRADCDAPGGFDCVFKGAQTAGTCLLPTRVGAGQDCSAPEAACGAGFYCDGNNCIAGENVGEPCTSSRQCSSTSFCGAAGLCEARGAIGTSCELDEECTSDLCSSVSATEAVCTDRVRLARSEPLCEDLR
jgi:hypothetical protein